MATAENLVYVTSGDTGTGNLSVTPVSSFQSFSDAFGTGGTNVFYYFIRNSDGNEYEIGEGHIDGTSGDLVRDTVLESTNNNSLVSFSPGLKEITNDYPANEIVPSSGGTFTGNVTFEQEIQFNNISVNSSKELYKNSGELFFSRFNLLKALNKSVVADTSTAGKYYYLYDIDMNSLQGVYYISMLVTGSGYGVDYEYMIPVTWDQDWMYSLSIPSNTWFKVTPSVFTGRHLLQTQDDVQLNAKVDGNLLSLRIFQRNTMDGGPVYNITITHSNEFRGTTITELNTTGTTTEPSYTIPVYLGAEIGDNTIPNNLGIGTPTPAAKLDVNGSITLDGGTTLIGSTEINLLNGMTSLTGIDSSFVTGTSGKNGNLIEWNADGDVVDSSLATSTVSNHVSSTSNPHSVTKSQVGLGNVSNNTQVINNGGTPSIKTGTAANRPAASVAGRWYLESDTRLLYRDTGSAWENIGGLVTSVFGRTGSITAQSSDYNASQVDYDSSGSDLTSNDVKAALDEIDGKFVPSSGGTFTGDIDMNGNIIDSVHKTNYSDTGGTNKFAVEYNPNTKSLDFNYAG